MDSPQQTRAAHKVILKEEIRTNTYDKVTGIVTISQNRALAIMQTQQYFIKPKTSDIGYTEPVKNIPVQVSHIYFEIIQSEHSI